VVGNNIQGVTLNGYNIDAIATNSAANKLNITNGTAVNLTGVLTGVRLDGTTLYGGAGSNHLTANTMFNLGLRGVNGETVSVYPTAHTTKNIASLVGLNTGLVTTNATVEVRGRNTPNDSGGGTFLFEPFVSTNSGINFAAGSASFQWSRIWDGTTVDAAWFGAFAGDDVADSDAINAALEYVHSLGRGVVKLGGGRYDIDKTILVPYRANLIGTEGWRLVENTSSIVTNSLYLTGGPTQFRLMDGADTDMLWFDSTDGYVRQPSETLEDGELVDSRLQDSMLENIIFFGNAGNQTKHNLRGVAAKSKWTINLRNCGFLSVAGRPLWLFDVNAAVIDDISFTSPGTAYGAKGMFVYSSADNFFGRIYAGGSSGPVLWLNSASTFKNVFNSQILFNAQLTNTIWEVSSWTTNTLANFTSGLPIDTGEPVELRTTGSPPTGFTDTQLYFAVKLATNIFGFHTNYALATNGIYLAGSGAASGTNWLTVGPAAGLYLSGGAGQNVFAGLRSDQNSGPGVVIRGGVGNFISGLEVGENTGTANGEVVADADQVGVLFDKDSARNRVLGTIYQQPTAFMVRSNALDNVMEATFTSVSTNFANVSSSANYTSLQRTLGGTATWGESATQTALDLTGNASGVRIIKLARTSGLTQQIGLGVGSDALNVWNETDSRGIALIGNNGTTASYQFGDASSATPPEAVIYGSSGSGVNVAGAAVKIYSDQSTGNANQADAFAVLTGDVGSSGSTAQTMTTKFVVEGGGDIRLTGAIQLGNASDTTLARSAAGQVTIEGVKIATQPATETLAYSTTTVTLTAGKGPNQSSALTCTNAFTLTFASVADNDGGTIWVHPAATNCTVTLTAPAYGPSGTTLTITGGTLGTNHTVLAWKATTVGGTNVVNVNALNYYR
jgi:hypothetical protein